MPGPAAIFLLLCAAGCAGRGTANPTALTSPPHRIVSLMPSLTEDLVALGAGPQIVAIDQYSADVPGAQKLPVVANFSSINAERIVSLHPDLIVGIPAQDRLLEPLRKAGIRSVLYRDDSFQDIFADIAGLGAATNRRAQALSLVKQLRERTASLHAKIHYGRAPTVFVVLDTNPIYTAGAKSYISTLIDLAGGRNAAAGLPASYASFSAEALLRLQPDAIVSDKTTGLQNVLQSEPWKSLHAVAKHRVFIVDPADILERPGPRYNEGLSWLIARLQPPAK